ncbi:MAG: hypothetical protein IH934_01920 [Nanoarchaeota archaeon]|nr:hypothetical protein [Nanoarchaeota archaeon]
MFRKSQAAMEFLMTYGWAILVVLVAIGALAYFGVLSPERFLPAKCVLPAGLACIDFKIETGGVTVVLRNGLGADLTAVSIQTDTCPKGVTGSVINGEKVTLVTNPTGACTLTIGAKFNEKLSVEYTNSESGLTKTISGTITGRVE